MGEVTGDGNVKLIEDSFVDVDSYKNNTKSENLPFDLCLETVLGKMNS